MTSKRIGYPAKISCPTLTEVISRPRLFKYLDRLRRNRVVWVMGPPGSGKTTLVTSYLKNRKLKEICYQLDARDTDPATFFLYMGQALEKAVPRFRKPMPLFQREDLLRLPIFTRDYFEKLSERLPKPFVLVFDNYHEIPPESCFHEIISEGLTQIQEGGNVIFISRTAPPPPMESLKANRLMAIAGWNDLRFTERETRKMAALRKGGRISYKELRFLQSKTDGWAAGIVLMMEWIRIHQQEGECFEGPVSEAVFNYFAGEIFRKLNPTVQEFLLLTAYLPSVTIEIAQALTKTQEAGKILSDLIHSNYFIAERPGKVRSFQYHDLFREFLLSCARNRFSESEQRQIQKQAGSMLETEGLAEDAVLLYTNAKDWETLQKTILREAPTLITQGRSQTLKGWIHCLPDAVVDENPWLSYWQGICALSFDPFQSLSYFERAYELFQRAGGDPCGLYLSQCGVVDAYVLRWGNFAPLDRWITEMENLQKRYPVFPSPEIEARVAVAMFCALMYRHPQNSDLPKWEERVLSFIEKGQDRQLRMTAGLHLILYYTWWTGDLSKAGLLLDLLRSSLKSMDPLNLILWHSMEATYYWMGMDQDASLAAADQGLKIAEESGIHLWDFMLLAQKVHASFASGDATTIRESLKKMSSLLNTVRRLDSCHYHFLSAAEAFYNDDFTRAETHAQLALQAAMDAGTPFPEAICRVVSAEVLFTQGNSIGAFKHLSWARRTGLAMRSTTIEYFCSMVKAYHLLVQQKKGGISAIQGSRAKSQGIQILASALAIGRTQGFYNLIWWKPSLTVPLYIEALDAGIEIEYVQEIIKQRKLFSEPSLECENFPWSVRIYTLGRFAIVQNDKPITFKGKAQRKPLELLQALIAYGGREVSISVLYKELWNESVDQRGTFDAALSRLRKLMREPQALRLNGNKLSLDPGLCWVDAWTFERLVNKAVTGSRIHLVSEKELIQALAYYKGRLFHLEEDRTWMHRLRSRLHRKFLQLVSIMGDRLQADREWQRAVDLYEEALQLDFKEEFYGQLMVCYGQLGDKAEVIRTYNRYCQRLKRVFSSMPSKKISSLYESLIN